MSKFKVGDKVIVIDSPFSHSFSNGSIGVIKDLYGDAMYEVSSVNTGLNWFLTEYEIERHVEPPEYDPKDVALKIDAKTGEDKRRFSLFAPLIPAIRAVLDVMESGNTKLPWRDAYPVDSWHMKSGDYNRRYRDALMRHVMDDLEGRDFTEDTQLYTLASVVVNALFLLQFRIEDLDKYPSHNGVREIKAMKEGRDPYDNSTNVS